MDRNSPVERATSAESTRLDERAMSAESATSLERAMSAESTKWVERSNLGDPNERTDM